MFLAAISDRAFVSQIRFIPPFGGSAKQLHFRLKTDQCGRGHRYQNFRQLSAIIEMLSGGMHVTYNNGGPQLSHDWL